jgi:tetratricopeptide (TPR) repeat protein
MGSWVPEPRLYYIRCRINMSYIHEALLKAQKRKDAQHPRHRRSPLSGSPGKPGILSARAVWVITFGLILLAFTLYSWLDSKGKKTVPMPENPKPEVHSGSEDLVQARECYERARGFHRIGRLEDARRLYQKTLMLDPGSIYAMNNLGVLYMQDKRYAEAQNNFEHAIRQKPDYVDPYYNLSCLHALKGETMKSLDHLKKAVSLDGSVREWARKDRDLQELRREPRFQEIIGATQ